MGKIKNIIQRIVGRGKEKELTVRSIVTDMYGGNVSHKPAIDHARSAGPNPCGSSSLNV